MPWSTPNTRPSLERMWPPLRSALLTSTSNTASSRSSGSSAWMTDTADVVGVQPLDAASNQPGLGTLAAGHQVDRAGVVLVLGRPPRPAASPDPSGPSTRRSPARSRSRRSGRPRTPPPRAARGCAAGSPTAAARPRSACRRTAHRRVGQQPGRGTSRSTPGQQPAGDLQLAADRSCGARRAGWPRPGSRAVHVDGPCAVRTERSAVAVGPGADVTGRVDRLEAERAGGRPAATRAWARATNSRAYEAVILTTNTSSASISSSSSAAVAGLLGGSVLGLVLAVHVGEQLDHDAVDVRVPGDRHGADPELLGDRRVERARCRGPAGRDRRARPGRRCAARPRPAPGRGARPAPRPAASRRPRW